ncbi:cytochrome P450 [Mycobacterium intracellulare]|uniref:cytochrome P450 n=1 Tax=Mycobacterium intracellulare TaxID=1767 RepID=UPI001CD98874|nr:cytochrome P450 [Mycobacterium intracellulare]MCA2276742.1 cytochrome P450 [Mycobacterium intracellulare]MCA2328459.1 cytochrome P450 [Mycobacterium intracellulare]
MDNRRKNPRGDDLLTDLLDADMDGRPLTEQEMIIAVATLLAGGHDTTVRSLSSLLYEVLSRPLVRQRLLEDPTLIPNAVEEALRLHPSFVGVYRRATSTTEVGGVTIPEGDSVYLNWTAGNRDPKVFEDPDEFSVERQARNNRHLTFGHGIRVCPGALTARMVLRVALEELLQRLPDIELIDPAAVEYKHLNFDSYVIQSMSARVHAG